MKHSQWCLWPPQAAPCTNSEQEADLAGPGLHWHSWSLRDKDLGRQGRWEKEKRTNNLLFPSEFWYILWHACCLLYEILSMLYEMLSMLMLDVLVQINVIQNIFCFLFLFFIFFNFHIPLFLRQNELWFEDIPTKKIYTVVEYNHLWCFHLVRYCQGLKW